MTHPTDTHTYRHIEFRGLSGAMGISRHDAEARRIAVLGVCVALPVGTDRGLLFTPKHVEGQRLSRVQIPPPPPKLHACFAQLDHYFWVGREPS